MSNEQSAERMFLEPMICKAYLDDEGDIVIEAMGGAWEGCISHGETVQEAFTNFGEAATMYAEAKNE